jgi:hypothetical protein
MNAVFITMLISLLVIIIYSVLALRKLEKPKKLSKYVAGSVVLDKKTYEDSIKKNVKSSQIVKTTTSSSYQNYDSVYDVVDSGLDFDFDD